MRQYKDALDSLETLERRFFSHRSDVQLGLRCKMLIFQGKWSEAMVVWHQLPEKTRPVHQGLLIRILEMQGQDTRVPLADRERAKSEAAELRTKTDFLKIFDMKDLEEIDESDGDS